MDTEFFARIVRSGTVLGAHPGMTSDEVERILGEDHSWDEDGDTLTWDYGLVSFVWHKEVGRRFVVRTRHLTFRLPFEDLRAAIDLVEAGPEEYRHPATGVVVRVDLATGDVHEIVGGPLDDRELPEPRALPKVHTSPVFFADIVATGTVLGVDAEMRPEAVRRVLGDPEYTNIGGSSWSYGLLELFWSSHFSVQAHRLRWSRRTVRFVDLRTELDRRGIELVELTGRQPDPEYAEYWHPTTRIVVIVYLPEDQVYCVQSRFRADYSAPFADHRAVRQSIKEVVDFSDRARLAWLERNKPAEHPEQWWLFHCRQISARATESDDPKWLAFALWAWAQPMGVAPAERAWEMATFTKSIEDHLPAVDRPSADSVVRACLAEVTSTTSPIDKSLVSAAEQHRHALEDPALLADLDRRLAARMDIPSASMPDL